jgi:protein-S-isoprenylcysteine O-methyltransferase Ste14
MSDRRSPDSIKLGGWLFRHRTALPLPIALAILLIPSSQTRQSVVEILVGVGLTVTGEAIRFWGVHHIGVISRTRSDRLGPLVDTGPFAYVRNPLYIGNILLWVGFAVTAGILWLAPVVFVLLAVEYHFIVRWEEELLLERRGDEYRAYCERVSRWIPKLNRRIRGIRRTTFDSANSAFSAVAFSERGTLIAIAAGYFLLWLKARF